MTEASVGEQWLAEKLFGFDLAEYLALVDPHRGPNQPQC